MQFQNKLALIEKKMTNDGCGDDLDDGSMDSSDQDETEVITSN